MDFSTLDEDTLETFAANGIAGAAEELEKRKGSIGSGADVTEAVNVDLTDPDIKKGIDTLKIFLEDSEILTPTDVLDPALRPSQLKDLSQDQIREILKSIGKPAAGDQSFLGPGGQPLTADLAGGIFGVPSVSDQLRALQAQREAAQAAFNPGQIAAIGNVLQGSPGFGMGINPVLSRGPSLPSAAFEGIPAALRTVDTANLTALNADLNEDGVVDELDEQIKVSQLVDQPFVPGVSFRPTETRKSGGIGNLIRAIFAPGSFLLENLPGRQYDMMSPLTARLSSDRRLIGPGAAVSGGIYSARNIGGGQTNTPLSMAADFYDPTTGKTRFDRAFDRFLKTGRTRDLIGASRSGAGARRLLRQARSGVIRDASGRNVIIPGRSTGVGGRGPGPGGMRETDTGGFGQADFGNRSDDKFGAL